MAPNLGRGGARRRLSAIAALRMKGYTYGEIANELDLTVRTVQRHVHELRQEIADTEPLQRLKREAVPLAVDNLIEGLAQKDKEYTLETLKGTGLLVQHNKHDGQAVTGPVNFALQVVIEQPPADRAQSADVLVGNVVGIPRQTGGPDAERIPEATQSDGDGGA